MFNENLEVTFEELYQSQEFSNSDNFKELSKRKNSDLIFLRDGKLTVLKIK